MTFLPVGYILRLSLVQVEGPKGRWRDACAQQAGMSQREPGKESDASRPSARYGNIDVPVSRQQSELGQMPYTYHRTSAGQGMLAATDD